MSRRRWLPRPATGGIAGMAALLVLGGAVPAGLPGSPRVAAATAAAPRVWVVSPAGPHRSLSEALRQAAPGDVIEVRGGRYPEHVVVDKPVRLIGVGGPVVDGGGRGTVLRIAAPGVTVRGLVVRASGSSLDREDAGIYVEAPRATIEANTLEDVLFGIYLKGAPDSRVRGNRIAGKEIDLGLKGDGIRVWFSAGTAVLENVVRGTRDVLVQESPRATLRGNTVEGGRYGLHFMYSDDCVVEDNALRGNSVGVYGMYSRRLTLRRNVLADNRGPSGYGIGLKDVDAATVQDNWVRGNRVGAYLDNSPSSIDVRNHFAGNAFVGNDIGLLFLPAVSRNVFAGNAFVDNLEQVAVHGGGRLAENTWTAGGRGNYWSDYAGYDADGDGLGDVPYRAVGLFENLMDRSPNLRWFLFSPATLAVDFAARAFPAVAPQPKLEDTAPLMAPRLPARPDPQAPAARNGLLLLSLGELALAAGLAGMVRGRPATWPT